MHRGCALLWCAGLLVLRGHPVEEVVGLWREPPSQVPGRGVPDGPLIGNGQLGGAFGWHTSEDALEVDLHLGHNAFFAAPSAGASSCGYSPGGRKALAGLTLRFAGTPSVVARQLAANGTVQLQLSGSQSGELTLSAFIHAENVVLLELQGDAAEVAVTLWTFSGCHGPARPPISPSTKVPEGGAPVSKTTGPTSDRLPSQMVAGPDALQVMRGNGWPFQAAHFSVRWFGLTATIRNEAMEKGQFHEVEAMGRCGPELFLRGPCARGTWRPVQGQSLAIQLSLWPLLEQPQLPELKPLAQLRASHANAWIDYWEQSFVYIPDSPITMFHWYMSHYLLRISSYGSAAPGLFGPFVTDDEVLWSGDITLNYNAEAVYYDAAAANHMEEVFEPYFQAILDFLPAAERMAQELYPNCPDALVFPAHILPNGVHAHGVGRGDLGQKQMGLFAAVPFILLLLLQ